MSDEDELANDDLMSNEGDEDEPLLPRSTLKDGQDVESEGHSSSGEETNFVNPLLKKKTIDAKGEISEGEWSDDADEKVVDKKKQKKEKKLLGKRKRADSDEDKVQEFFVDDKIEVVPANDPGTLQTGYESMDSTEMAETRILAKKMLRKKQRTEILDQSYNRYSFHEDPRELPSWFVEDEQKHYFRHH